MSEMKSFLERTSIKGVPRIIKHQKLPLKALWFVGVLVLATFAIYNINNVFTSYMAWPKVTTLLKTSLVDPGAEEAANDVELPAFTLCNLNPFPTNDSVARGHGIITWGEYTAMMEQEIDVVEDRLEATGQLETPDNQLLLQRMRYLASYSGYFQYIGVKNASIVGHSRVKFIVQCSASLYASASEKVLVDCYDSEDFTWQFLTPEFFRCHTIYPAVDEGYLIATGVSVMLHVDQADGRLTDAFDPMNDNIQSSGVRVAIHDRKVMPDIWDGGFDIPPGHFTSVLGELTVVKRLGKPYGICVDTHPPFYDLSGRSLVYSVPACINACLQEAVVQNCTCFDPEIIVTDNLDYHDLPLCGSRRVSLSSTVDKLNCAYHVKASYMYICASSCAAQCMALEVKKTMSSSPWPKESQQLSFYETMIKNNPHIMSPEYAYFETIDEFVETGQTLEAEKLLKASNIIQKHFAKVRLSLNGLEFLVVEEKPQMSLTGLMSMVGGILNLYNGVSLIVLVEVLELLYNLLMALSGPMETRVAAIKSWVSINIPIFP